jgi:hypothetical protein
MQSGKVPGFLPSVSGLHFSNLFDPGTNYPVITLPVVGTISGDAHDGLCGGFVFTVLDMFLHQPRLAPPMTATPPAGGTTLFNYLANRLLDSFAGSPLPNGVKVIEWIQVPSHDTVFRVGLSSLLVNWEWPLIKADIDAGRPSSLSLVMAPWCATDLNVQCVLAALHHCHQVLAYAYLLDDNHILTLSVYDPNDPDNDSSTIVLDISNPAHTIDITAADIQINLAEPAPIRGFFRSSYSVVDPVALNLSIALIDGLLLRQDNGAIWVIFGGAKFHVPDPNTLNRLYGGMPVVDAQTNLIDGIPTAPVDGTLLREENGAIWIIFGRARFHVPDPDTLNRLYGGRPVHQLWNGALDGIPMVPADGTLLREESGAIWVIAGGARFHVPDPDTLIRLYPGRPILQLWNGGVDGIPTIPADGSLLREENGAIWVTFDGAKFHVPDSDTLNRLYGGRPFFQLWNGALDAIPAIPTDGTLLREENGAIWVIVRGAKFHVPDPATLNRLFAGRPIFQLWNGALDAIPGIPADSTLLREENGAIWVILGGAKFHVPDPGTLSRLYGGWPFFQLWNGALDQIPGIPVDGTLLREENGAIWVVLGGAKFHVPDPATLTRLFGGKPILQVWNGALDAVPLVPVNGTLFREESSARVFVVEGGRLVNAALYDVNAVHVVWDGALSQISNAIGRLAV